MLDLACGTGIVARLAKERVGEAGRVVGIDVSAPMLAVAKAIAPTVDWREGNAAALPVAVGEAFDVVCCQQGIQFFAEPEAAREMKRVLRPGGRLAVATWYGVDESPINAGLQHIAERHLGAFDDLRYGLGDAATLERLVRSAGFAEIRLARVSRTIHLADAAVFIRMNTMALTGMSTASASMSDEERARIVDVIAKERMTVVTRYAEGPGLAFELATNLATARA